MSKKINKKKKGKADSIQSKCLVNRLKEILIRQVGDTRTCQHCGKDFIPNDITAIEAFEIYKELFGTQKGT